MESKSNIESIRTWLRSCPAIDNNRFFRVDYIDDDPECYAIYSVPSPLTYKKDILGAVYYDDVQTMNFYFCIICPWGKDITQNMENIRAATAVIEWMQEQNMSANFPTLEEGEVVSILPTLTPQPLQQTAETAIYQISIQLKYRR